MQTYRIKPGYGYWDITHYPIGGCFARTLATGVMVHDVVPMDRPYRGATHTGMTDAGNRRVAFDLENATPVVV
jgi:hypothetical protein